MLTGLKVESSRCTIYWHALFRDIRSEQSEYHILFPFAGVDVLLDSLFEEVLVQKDAYFSFVY
jgi:hypothetical protein